MRDYKFRGKRIDNGEWVYGYYYHSTINGGDYIADAIKTRAEEIDLNTLGQYTGLHDKNGKEIYEGDIYHQGDKNILYVVVWHDTSFIGKQLKSSSYAGLTYWLDRIEVIGNIYDNPGLLQK